MTKAEKPKSTNPNAVRQSEWRRRQRQGLRVLSVEVEDNSFADGLIRAGWLRADQTLDRALLSNAAAEVLNEWISLWEQRDR
jgi:hypothetical protein